jgi:hypothetical protein
VTVGYISNFSILIKTAKAEKLNIADRDQRNPRKTGIFGHELIKRFFPHFAH